MSIHIGISGWVFEDWRGSFYPEGLKQKDELAYASARLGSIEINGTFHRLQKPATFQSWYAQIPGDFPLAIKSPKFITHERRLKDFEKPLANFMASGILALKEKLGPILWQFPPTLAFDPERFEPFMAALPHDTTSASELGRNHSDWMAERAFLEVDTKRPLRHAFEVRHHGFKTPQFVALAKRYGIAIVVSDTAGRWPHIEEDTADFFYARLHGDEVLYPNGYTKSALEEWAEKMRQWKASGKPVFAYFDNDTKATAPFDALSMISHLTQLGEIPEKLAPKLEGIRKASSSLPTRPSLAKAKTAKSAKSSKDVKKKPSKSPRKSA